jgi:hypothetical protein
MPEMPVKTSFGDVNGLLGLIECEQMNVDWLLVWWVNEN